MTPCMTGTELFVQIISLRLSDSLPAGTMIIIAIFTDKTTDKIQIPLIYLDCPFGIRLCPLPIFFFQNHLLNIHSGCQYARYCYSYD